LRILRTASVAVSKDGARGVLLPIGPRGPFAANSSTGRVRIHEADYPDRLRGGYLDGAVLDEYADIRPSVLGTVIRPMLADRHGWLTLIGTPKRRNDFHKWWERARTDTRWFRSMLKASETGLIAESELRDARLDMTEEEYAQEFECSFDAAIRGAYYGKSIAEIERSGHRGEA
jgi:phage terminase large subunit